MKLRKLGLAVAAVVIASPASAGGLRVAAGVLSWNADFSGTVTSGSDAVDVAKDLNLDKGYFTQAYALIEHPVPFLPNVKIQYTNLHETADGQVSARFDNITASTPVHTDLDLSHTDLVLYYELLDNVVSVDAGLDLKWFKGNLTLTNRLNPLNESNTDLNVVVPMLYLAPAVNLPLTGLSLGAEVAGIGYAGNRLVDASIHARYEYTAIGLEAGWRQLNVKLSDVDNIDADVKIGGPYLSFLLAF